MHPRGWIEASKETIKKLVESEDGQFRGEIHFNNEDVTDRGTFVHVDDITFFNCGLIDLEELADQGHVFRGYMGEGEDSDAEYFASEDNELFHVTCSHAGELMIPISWDGKIEADDLITVLAFLGAWRQFECEHPQAFNDDLHRRLARRLANENEGDEEPSEEEGATLAEVFEREED